MLLPKHLLLRICTRPRRTKNTTRKSRSLTSHQRTRCSDSGKSMSSGTRRKRAQPGPRLAAPASSSRTRSERTPPSSTRKTLPCRKSSNAINRGPIKSSVVRITTKTKISSTIYLRCTHGGTPTCSLPVARSKATPISVGICR
jgi:hypothetical protein